MGNCCSDEAEIHDNDVNKVDYYEKVFNKDNIDDKKNYQQKMVCTEGRDEDFRENASSDSFDTKVVISETIGVTEVEKKTPREPDIVQSANFSSASSPLKPALSAATESEIKAKVRAEVERLRQQRKQEEEAKRAAGESTVGNKSNGVTTLIDKSENKESTDLLNKTDIDIAAVRANLKARVKAEQEAKRAKIEEDKKELEKTRQALKARIKAEAEAKALAGQTKSEDSAK